MTGNVKVVDGGTEAPSPPRPPQGPSWFWVVVGFVIGLGLAIVFFTAGSDEPSDPPVTVATPELDRPDVTPSTVTPTTRPVAEGVGEVVVGFPDTLIAVTQLGSGNLGQLTWPVRGPTRVRDLPGFFTPKADFDASGRMVAMGTQIPDTAGLLLSLGTARRVQPLASDVTGFAWHDREGGRLAYTQVEDGEWLLYVVDTAREPELVTRSPDIAGTVAAWGDWGFAIQDGDRVTILSVEGEIRQDFEGHVLESDPEGRVVLYDGSLRLVDAAGSAELLDVDLTGIGEPETGALSPDGTKLALVGGAGHLVLPLDGGEPTYAPVTSGYPQLAWSSDSRFLISPWIRGVLFIDTEGSAQPVAELTSYVIVAVTTVPLGGG